MQLQDLIEDCNERLTEADRQTGALAHLARDTILQNIYLSLLRGVMQRNAELVGEAKRVLGERPSLRDRIARQEAVDHHPDYEMPNVIARQRVA